MDAPPRTWSDDPMATTMSTAPMEVELEEPDVDELPADDRPWVCLLYTSDAADE